MSEGKSNISKVKMAKEKPSRLASLGSLTDREIWNAPVWDSELAGSAFKIGSGTGSGIYA